MANKLSLAPAPTFKALVAIPVPGGKPAPVEFTFRGRSRDEFKALCERLADLSDVEAILECASGWDLDEPFDAASVERLNNAYLGAARAVLERYIAEVSGARLGN